MSKQTNSNKGKLKIVLLGDQNTGKTSIIQRFINNNFQQNVNPTIGIDFLGKNVTYNNKTYRLQLWDTAGQERFRSLIPNYLKDAICAIYVFDISNQETLQNLQKWMQLFKENKSNSTVTAICANKIDLEKKYEKSTLDQIILKNKIPVFQISALTGKNIPEMFYSIVQMINQLKMKNQSTKKIEEDDSQPPLTSTPIKLLRSTTSSQNLQQKLPRKYCCY